MIVTTEEAAAIVGCHEKTIRRWVLAGLLEPVRRGAKPLRFREDDVLELDVARMTAHDRAAQDRARRAFEDGACS